jgi:hypothetical protein
VTEIHVFLGIFQFGDDPQVVTDLLGVAPTKAWAPGAAMPGKAGERGGRWPHGRWVLVSPGGRQASVEEQLLSLLPLLEERPDALAEAKRRYEVGLMCAAYYHEVNPGFHLDVELLRRVAALGLDLDFDLYCLAGTEENDVVGATPVF